jgi:hypothetical protein
MQIAGDFRDAFRHAHGVRFAFDYARPCNQRQWRIAAEAY